MSIFFECRSLQRDMVPRVGWSFVPKSVQFNTNIFWNVCLQCAEGSTGCVPIQNTSINIQMNIQKLLKIRLFLQHYGSKIDLPKNVSLETLQKAFAQANQKNNQIGLIELLLHRLLMALALKQFYLQDNKSLRILALIREANNCKIKFNTAALGVQCIKQLAGQLIQQGSSLNVMFNKERLLALEQPFNKNSCESKIQAILFLIETICRTPKFLSKQKGQNDEKQTKYDKFFGKDTIKCLGSYQYKKHQYKMVIFKDDTRAIYRFESGSNAVTILDSFQKVADIVISIKKTDDPYAQEMIIMLRDVIKDGIINFQQQPQEDISYKIDEQLDGDCWQMLAQAEQCYSQYAEDCWGSEWNSSLDQPFAQVLKKESQAGKIRMLINIFDNCQSIINYYEKDNMPRMNSYKKKYTVEEMKKNGFSCRKVQLKFLKNLEHLCYLLTDVQQQLFPASQQLVINIMCRILACHLTEHAASMTEKLNRMRKHEQESKKAARSNSVIVEERASRRLNNLRRSQTLPEEQSFERYLNAKKFKKQSILNS